MNKWGPIVIIDDDSDDHFIYGLVLKELGFRNEVVFFIRGADVIAYLKTPNLYPFLVISDINMPEINGLALRDLIRDDKTLADKCIPFIFFTTASSRAAVAEAYTRCVQGYFVKPATLSALKATLETVIRYWQLSRSPSRLSE